MLVGVEVEEQLLHLVHDLGDAGVAAVDLVHHEDHGEARLERLAQHEPGLRQRALAGVDEQEHAVDHGEPPLDLAAEVGVAGRVDDVDLHVAVAHRGVLGQDRDALLALEVHRVHDAVGDFLVGAERAGLAQHGVDEGGLAVVDVGDDRDVAEGARGRHEYSGAMEKAVRGTVLGGTGHSTGGQPAAGSGCTSTSAGDAPGHHRGRARRTPSPRSSPGSTTMISEPTSWSSAPQVGAVVAEHHEHEVRHRADEGGEDARPRPAR